MRHQRLGTRMAGADRHLALIQYGADVVGMNPLDREADDPGRILRPEQADAVEGGECVPRLADERGLMGVDRLQPDLLDIVDGGVKADHAYHMRRSSLEAGRSEEHTSELQSLMRISY